MAFEDKVYALEVELQELGQQIQALTMQLNDWMSVKSPGVQVRQASEKSVSEESEINRINGGSEDQTRPLRSENILVDPHEYSFPVGGYEELELDTFDDDHDNLTDGLIDFIPLDHSKDALVRSKNKDTLVSDSANEATHAYVDSVQSVERQQAELFDGWNDLKIEEWIDESYPQTDSCFSQFCFLFHWIEETVEYIGQEKMGRTLHLYNRHGYIPDKVYILLRDVIQLIPKKNQEAGDTHRIINSLMELNGILEGNIRIGMNELMEIVG